MFLALFLKVQGGRWSVRRSFYVTATGTVKCWIDNQHRPLPFIKVQLLDGEVGRDMLMAEGRADGNGYFSLTGTGNDAFGRPDPKMRVIYDYSGTYGNMKVENALGQPRDHCTDRRRYSRYITIDVNINDEHCRAYYRFYHDGLKYFYDNVGRTPPYSTLHVRTNALLSFGQVYSTLDVVRIRRGEVLTSGTTRHEFAHTFRHSYDGTFAHFTWDAARFLYTRTHGCSTQANFGFAFNEGWAEYWQGACTGNTGTNYRIEGNVASALRSLATRCSTTKAQMVDVLRLNPGRIHSFCDFNRYHGLRRNGCKLPSTFCLTLTLG